MNINRIEADIANWLKEKNETEKNIAAIFCINYTTFRARRLKKTWWATDIEKFSAFFNRKLQYYFEEGEITKPNLYKTTEFEMQVLNDDIDSEKLEISEIRCEVCWEKEKKLKERNYTIEIQKKLIAELEAKLSKKITKNCG